MNPNNRPRIDYTNKDYASLREAMLALAREKLPDWTDHSPNDLGVVLLELFAYMGDILLYYQDRIANESYLETAVEPGSVVNLLRLIGCELRPPQPASAELVLFFKKDATGTVTIRKGAEFKTTARATGEVVHFQYLGEDLEIDLGRIDAVSPSCCEEAKTTCPHRKESYKCYQTLPVRQVDAVVPEGTPEVLGSSDGRPSQRYALAQKPLIDGTLVVMVDEGAGPKAWEEQDTLLKSDGHNEHYTVQRDADDRAWVIFGDGKHGRVPPRGRHNITAAYRTGGGTKGNVPSWTITKVVDSIGDILKHACHKDAASGGAEREPLSEARRRGPQLFRAMGRAVTAQDYEAFAREFGVGKARARASGWNRIELFVAPVGGGQPTDTLKENLRVYFEDKRIMTSILEIQSPTYVNVFIRGWLNVESYFFQEQVQQRVQNAVRELMAFEKVKFGDTLYLSKVFEAIEAIEGVAAVGITHFTKKEPPKGAEGLPDLNDGCLSFDWHEIPRVGYPQGISFPRVEGGRRAG